MCRMQFGKLGEMIAAHSRLKEHSQFLFIPGPDDAGIDVVDSFPGFLISSLCVIHHFQQFFSRSFNGSSQMCSAKLFNWRTPKAHSQCYIFNQSLQVKVTFKYDCMTHSLIVHFVLYSSYGSWLFLWFICLVTGSNSIPKKLYFSVAICCIGCVTHVWCLLLRKRLMIIFNM